MDIVTLKDIYAAVCDCITERTDIIAVDSDIEEPVERPVFKVFMETVNVGFYSSGLRQVKAYFNIYYYARNKNRSKSEIMDIEDTLGAVFLKPLKIKENCAVYIDEPEFEEVEDGILHFSFNIDIATEFIDESNIEEMKEIIIKN